MNHRHEIKLNQTVTEPIENEIETKRSINGKKAEPYNIDYWDKQIPFFREISFGETNLLIDGNPDSKEYSFHFGTSNDYDNIVSGKFAPCCDQMMNDLNSFIAKEQRIIEDTRKTVDRLAQMMVGDDEISDEAEAFENGFLLINNSTKE